MTARPEQLIRHIRRLATASALSSESDAALLDHFVRRHDDESFAALVQRHGPMVLGVCRRILGNVHDAEDAFQAAFLVLARKAASVQPREALTAWLYGVARRVALKARTAQAKHTRDRHPLTGPVVDPQVSPLDDLSSRELLAIFDEEIQRLPRVYRLPLILCCLEGRSQEEAARQLGWTAGSVKGRLERGRVRLQARLTRRGLMLSAALMVVEATRGSVAAALMATTIRERLQFVAGKGMASAAGTLAEMTLRGMSWSRGAVWAALMSMLFVVAGTGTLALRTLADKPQESEQPRARASEQQEPRKDQQGDPLPRGAIARLGTVRLRREDQTACDFAFTPDGKALVSARNPKVVQFWDVKTGKPLQEFRHKNRFITFALSANGKLLATGNREEIIVWDVPKRKQLRKFAAKDAYDSLLAFSPDNGILAAASASDWIIHLWDIASGKEKRQLTPHREALGSLHFSSDGKTLIVAEHSAIRLWDVAGGREVRKIEVGNVKGIALSQDGAVLVSGGSELVNNVLEARLILWDTVTGRKLRQLRGHKHFVNAVAFSPDGKTLASAEVETIYLWDVATGKEIRRIEKSGWIKHRLAFSPDGKTLASTAPGNETVIRLWDVATGKPLQPAGPDGVVRALAFSPDGRFVATGCWLGNDYPLRLWDASTGKPLWTCPREQVDFINRVVFTPDGKGLFSSAIDGMVRLWDARTGKEIRQYPIPECGKTVVELALSPDGQRLTAIGQSKDDAYTVVVWDVRAGKRLLQREGRHPSFLNIPSFSADAKIIAEPKGKTLRLYEVATGQLLLHLETSARWPGQNMAESVAFSPNGRTVATLTYTPNPDKKGNEAADCTIYLWELASGKPCLRISAGKGRYHAIAFAPDGRTLAAGGKGVLQLWDAATGKKLLAYRGQESGVFHSALAFSRDGTRLAAGYLDSTALIWDLTPGLRRLKAFESRDSRDLPQLWSDLADKDAAKAHAAIWAIIAAQDKAMRLLKDRLKPIETVDPRRIRRLVADLDSGEFAVRDAATKELEQIGEQADPLLRETLEKKPTLEVRRRIEGLLARPRFVLAGESLRGVRAIQVLEHLGTTEARTLLRNLANGAAGARLTEEARQALRKG
jgi:RNA polymerase sigma factor (sigma-70 family)